MTRSDVLRRLAAAAAVCAIGGCAHDRPTTAASAARPTTAPAMVPAVRPDAAPAAAVWGGPPAALHWTAARMQTIDGKPGAWDQHAYGGVTIAAGTHTLRLHLQDDWAPLNEATSHPDVEVTFTAEAGHQYQLDGWPTAVRDTTDHHPDGRAYAVDQTTRYTNWEE